MQKVPNVARKLLAVIVLVTLCMVLFTVTDTC